MKKTTTVEEDLEIAIKDRDNWRMVAYHLGQCKPGTPLYDQAMKTLTKSMEDFKKDKDHVIDPQFDEAIKLRIKLDESYKREEILENNLRELRRDQFRFFNDEECWVFQEGEDNYLDSLVCPVVIRAAYLKDLINR